jgi:hypothetical protein
VSGILCAIYTPGHEKNQCRASAGGRGTCRSAPEIFNRIEAALKAEPETSASFEAAHISYYLGALLIIGAMGWFITNGWSGYPG